MQQDQAATSDHGDETRAARRNWLPWCVVLAIIGGVTYFSQRGGPALALAEEAPWSQGWNDAVRRSRDSGKPALVLYTAGWCPACRWFESNVLVQPDVRATMESRYTPIMVDLTEAGSPNEALARQYKIESLPTLVVYDSGGGEIARAHAMEADELLEWLRRNYRAGR
jgi:thiol:disulfide interchange protein